MPVNQKAGNGGLKLLVEKIEKVFPSNISWVDIDLSILLSKSILNPCHILTFQPSKPSSSHPWLLQWPPHWTSFSTFALLQSIMHTVAKGSFNNFSQTMLPFFSNLCNGSWFHSVFLRAKVPQKPYIVTLLSFCLLFLSSIPTLLHPNWLPFC